jgi:acyl-CoA thioesterase-1
VRFRFLVVVSLVLAASCSTAGPAPTATETAPDTRARAALASVSALTALGDSVPYGTACNCTPFPQITATNIARITHHAVKDFNDSFPGFQSTDVLAQLRGDASAIADVTRADAVMIEVGANDIAFSSACGTKLSCYTSRLPQVATNVTAIVTRVRQLTAGRQVLVVLLDYWSVWLGGQYARAQGPAYVRAASSLTHAFSGAMHSIAATTGSVYVDLRTAFRGPDDDHDETNLLAGDGDHPDAEGHERIATAILQTLPEG